MMTYRNEFELCLQFWGIGKGVKEYIRAREILKCTLYAGVSYFKTYLYWLGHYCEFDYQEYLKSDHWLDFREIALEHYFYECAFCGKKDGLEVHHKNYLRLGVELLSDVVVLCDECHERHHMVEI